MTRLTLIIALLFNMLCIPAFAEFQGTLGNKDGVSVAGGEFVIKDDTIQLFTVAGDNTANARHSCFIKVDDGNSTTYVVPGGFKLVIDHVVIISGGASVHSLIFFESTGQDNACAGTPPFGGATGPTGQTFFWGSTNTASHPHVVPKTGAGAISNFPILGESIAAGSSVGVTASAVATVESIYLYGHLEAI